MELAAAALGDTSARRRVAAAAAHEVAAVGARRMPVAQPATSARRPGLRVWIAETARAFDVDEVVAGRPVEDTIALDQPRALAVERDLGGSVVTVS